MGMAASQARFLGLTARKTNVEYEGQQINQQRTALANQSAGLFNQMLALKVPTPPLATNYSKIEYVFTDPSTSNSISLDSIYKNPVVGTNKETYTVSGYSKSKATLSNISTITGVGTGANKYSIQTDEKDKSKYTISVNGGTRMTLNEPKQYNALISSFVEAEKAAGNNDESSYPKEGDTFFKYTNAGTGIEYYIQAGRYEQKTQLAFERNEDGSYKTDESGNKIPVYEKDENGNDTTTQATEPAYEQEENGKYKLTSKGEKQAIYETVPETLEELAERAAAGENFKVYSAESYTKSNQFHYDDAQITSANDGTGRFDSITFYTEDQRDPVSGEPLPDATPVTCKLTQQTVQDDDAFNAAMETYNAEKAIYDKTVSDIDSKTAIIQQQDKTLELHLDQLDTEQQAIQTEMEAIKKVIDKNIDETFKSFA